MTRHVATKEVFDNTIKVSPEAATFSGLFSKSEKLQGRIKDVSTQTPDVSTSPKLVLQGEDLKEYQEFLRHKMSSEPTLIPPVYPTAQTEQPAPISYTMGFSEAKYSDSKELHLASSFMKIPFYDLQLCKLLLKASLVHIHALRNFIISI